ncbi:hypothetical protein D3C81_1813690 [compost metagenome]
MTQPPPCMYITTGPAQSAVGVYRRTGTAPDGPGTCRFSTTASGTGGRSSSAADSSKRSRASAADSSEMCGRPALALNWMRSWVSASMDMDHLVALRAPADAVVVMEGLVTRGPSYPSPLATPSGGDAN